jgi:hydrogenase nickel incorporation protein HypA/HybF
MHEMALAESMLGIVEQAARAHGAAKVTAVRLELGTLAHVEAEALRFCFDVMSRDTVAEGAALEIDAVPGEGWCMPCARRVPVPTLASACPQRGSPQLAMSAGEEMRLKDIAIA